MLLSPLFSSNKIDTARFHHRAFFARDAACIALQQIQLAAPAEALAFHVEIAISDTDVGSKPDFLTHVFERFRPAEACTTRQHGGTVRAERFIQFTFLPVDAPLSYKQLHHRLLHL